MNLATFPQKIDSCNLKLNCLIFPSEMDSRLVIIFWNFSIFFTIRPICWHYVWIFRSPFSPQFPLLDRHLHYVSIFLTIYRFLIISRSANFEDDGINFWIIFSKKTMWTWFEKFYVQFEEKSDFVSWISFTTSTYSLLNGKSLKP